MQAVSRPSVLLLQSDGDTRDKYAAYLALSGFDVVAAASTEEALLLALNADIVITGLRHEPDRSMSESDVATKWRGHGARGWSGSYAIRRRPYGSERAAFPHSAPPEVGPSHPARASRV